jgi:hypothetical protein
VFLSDFGVARRMSGGGLTATGALIGSIDYCPPEQIQGLDVDGRADVYSLGAVAFHCLTGRPPFPKESDVAVIQAHLADPVPALSSVAPGLPAALDGVLAKAMAKDRDQRYDTAGAFAAAFAEAAPSRSADTVPVALLPRPVPPAPSRRRRLWAIGAVLLLALAGGLVAAMLLHGGGSHAATTTSTTTTTSTPAAAVTVSAQQCIGLGDAITKARLISGASGLVLDEDYAHDLALLHGLPQLAAGPVADRLAQLRTYLERYGAASRASGVASGTYPSHDRQAAIAARLGLSKTAYEDVRIATDVLVTWTRADCSVA